MNILIPFLLMVGIVCVTAATGLAMKGNHERDDILATQDSIIAQQDTDIRTLTAERDRKQAEIHLMAGFVKHLVAKAQAAHAAQEAQGAAWVMFGGSDGEDPQAVQHGSEASETANGVGYGFRRSKVLP